MALYNLRVQTPNIQWLLIFTGITRPLKNSNILIVSPFKDSLGKANKNLSGLHCKLLPLLTPSPMGLPLVHCTLTSSSILLCSASCTSKPPFLSSTPHPYTHPSPWEISPNNGFLTGGDKDHSQGQRAYNFTPRSRLELHNLVKGFPTPSINKEGQKFAE